MPRPTIALIVTVLAGRLLDAQSSAIPSFDVASVKPNQSRDTESASFVQPGGRYTATNVTLRMLLKSAYGLHDDQLVGGPSWINSDRFDVAAKAEGYSTASVFRDQARLMLRPLLTDRFKVVIRREQRDLPVYALAKAGKVLGPQIRLSGVHHKGHERVHCGGYAVMRIVLTASPHFTTTALLRRTNLWLTTTGHPES